jgi:predicted DNA-binding transcriptional regulator AlpA
MIERATTQNNLGVTPEIILAGLSNESSKTIKLLLILCCSASLKGCTEMTTKTPATPTQQPTYGSYKDLGALFKASRGTVRKLTKDPTFPKDAIIKHGSGFVRFDMAKVQAWFAQGGGL